MVSYPENLPEEVRLVPCGIPVVSVVVDYDDISRVVLKGSANTRNDCL